MNNPLLIISVGDILGLIVLGLLVLGFGGYWVWIVINSWIYNLKIRAPDIAAKKLLKRNQKKEKRNES